MRVEGYSHFGGRHGEAAAIKNVLAFLGVRDPDTGKPLSEALCFGIAGGIGAGYSFCPSVVRWGNGSGVSIVGRYKSYATDATWYQGFADRLGLGTRVTETTGEGKAYQNLVGELAAGRPAVVWCSRPLLPFLGRWGTMANLGMHSFVVCAVDEAKGQAFGSDRAPTPVSLTLPELAKARAGVCSHKNRTLSFDPPAPLERAVLQRAVVEGVRACVQELHKPRMKTFSLAGLEHWAKMITNATNKDGWRKVFAGGLLFDALRDAYDSIETEGTGGGLFRGLYADFLDEAAVVTKNGGLGEAAACYRNLYGEWNALAEALLPAKVKPFKQTRELLQKKCQLLSSKGEKASKQIAQIDEQLVALKAEVRGAFPLLDEEAVEMLEALRERILKLHQMETKAAERLRAAVA